MEDRFRSGPIPHKPVFQTLTSHVTLHSVQTGLFLGIKRGMKGRPRGSAGHRGHAIDRSIIGANKSPSPKPSIGGKAFNLRRQPSRLLCHLFSSFFFLLSLSSQT